VPTGVGRLDRASRSCRRRSVVGPGWVPGRTGARAGGGVTLRGESVAPVTTDFSVNHQIGRGGINSVPHCTDTSHGVGSRRERADSVLGMDRRESTLNSRAHPVKHLVTMLLGARMRCQHQDGFDNVSCDYKLPGCPHYA
jgi:hypothetical protein